MNLFLDRLHGKPIGFSVVGIFVIEKNTILAVRIASVYIVVLFSSFMTKTKIAFYIIGLIFVKMTKTTTKIDTYTSSSTRRKL